VEQNSNSMEVDSQPGTLQHLPENFDWCQLGMCTASWNQHIPNYCGSCYLHASLSSVNDRIKLMIQRSGIAVPDVILSRQTFLNCAPGVGLSEGCVNGEAPEVFAYMKQYGLPDETCMPYNATDNRKYGSGNPECPPIGYCMNCFVQMHNGVLDYSEPYCFPITNMIKYYVSDYGTVEGAENMKVQIYKHGPIACEIHDSAKFTFDISSGTFTDFSLEPDGTRGNASFDHLVEIVGWGTDTNGMDYWQGRNSWGTYWGQNGFFRIERGKNALRIEEVCHWATPNITELLQVVSGSTPLFSGGMWGLHQNFDVLAQPSTGVDRSPSKKFQDLPSLVISSWKIVFVAVMVGALLGFLLSQSIKIKKQEKNENILISFH